MKKQKKLLDTIHKHLKKVAKRIAEAINSLAVAAAALQASGVLALQPAMLQLKIMLGILGLNMIVHRIKHPFEWSDKHKKKKKK